jgi:MFS family permease
LASTQLNISNSLIASLGAPEGLSTFGVRLFIGKILKKMTAKRLVILTFSAEVVIGLLLPFATAFTHLVILALFAGVLHGINNPTSALLVADVSTSADRGFANSVLYLANSGGALAPMIAIAAATAWGLTSVFPIATILPVVTIIVAAKFMERLSTELRKIEGSNTQPKEQV